MHELAVILVAVAGLAYCVAAVLRWRALSRQGEAGHAYLWLLWIGLALHSASLALSLVDSADQSFLYGVLGSWAAVASLFFLSRFLAVPSKWLLILPVGGMALLVAMAGATGDAIRPAPSAEGGLPWIIILHIVFMATHLAAMLLAGAAGALYLIAVGQLKSATIGAFKLPNLPLLEHLSERSLVIATALLIGGLATGGAAMRLSPGFSLMHPTALLGLATMTLLVVALALRLANRLGRRGVATAAISCLVLATLSLISLMVGRHG